MMVDPQRSLEVLKRLHNMGIALSIDDFGTGYSSLAYLKELPVNELKIDRTFVEAMTSNRGDAFIVRSTIDLAHNLSLQVVAEGVEDQQTMDELAGLGCNVAQGFHLSRPLPPQDFAAWLASSGAVAVGRATSPEKRGTSVGLRARPASESAASRGGARACTATARAGRPCRGTSCCSPSPRPSPASRRASPG